MQPPHSRIMVPQGSPSSNDPLPQTEPIQFPGCRGFVATAAAPELQELLASLPDPAYMTCIKRSTVRTVLHGKAGKLDVHLKLHRAVTLSDHARDRLRGDRGTREARNLLAASALGLPAATPLAYGVCDSEQGPRAFLITNTIAGAVPFSFESDPSVLREVGKLLRRAHDRGLLPGDLHQNNLVIDRIGQPWLLDLATVKHLGDADLPSRAKSLAFLCQQLDGGALDPQAHLLLFGYLDLGRALPESFTDELASATRRLRSRVLSAFGRRSERPCRHTAIERDGARRRWRLHQVQDEVDRDELHLACREFLFAPPEPDKKGRRGAVWLGDDIVVKQRAQGAARKLFEAMYWLLAARIPQPEPVALATFHGDGHVFTRRLPAPTIARELTTGRLVGPDLLDAARRLGDSVGRLHAHGLRNRDLKFDNLVRHPFSGEICMTDLDGVKRKRTDDRRGQGRDLGRLLAAFRDAGSPGGTIPALAFAKAYLRSRLRLLQPAESRRIWRVASKRAREWERAHVQG